MLGPLVAVHLKVRKIAVSIAVVFAILQLWAKLRNIQHIYQDIDMRRRFGILDENTYHKLQLQLDQQEKALDKIMDGVSMAMKGVVQWYLMNRRFQEEAARDMYLRKLAIKRQQVAESQEEAPPTLPTQKPLSE